MEKYWVITFPSTYHALRAEKVLKENGYNIPLAPIPRHLSANCGEVLRLEPELKLEVEGILESNGVIVDGVYLIEPQERKSLLDKFFGF